MVEENLKGLVGDKMKRNVALFVAALCMLVVSTAQAATNVHFLTQTATGLVPTRDLHYRLTDANNLVLAEDKVVDPDGVVIQFNLDPGDYVLFAEQPSTKYFGTMPFVIADAAPDTPSDTPTPLAKAKVSEIFAQSAEGGEGADDRYVVLGPNGMSEVSESEVASGTGAAVVTEPVAPVAETGAVYPSYPSYSYPTGGASYPAGGRLGGWLGAAGLAGGIVALATSNSDKDKPKPVSIVK